MVGRQTKNKYMWLHDTCARVCSDGGWVPLTGDDLCKAGKYTNNYQTSCLGGLLLGATALLAALHIVPLALKLERTRGWG